MVGWLAVKPGNAVCVCMCGGGEGEGAAVCQRLEQAKQGSSLSFSPSVPHAPPGPWRMRPPAPARTEPIHPRPSSPARLGRTRPRPRTSSRGNQGTLSPQFIACEFRKQTRIYSLGRTRPRRARTARRRYIRARRAPGGWDPWGGDAGLGGGAERREAWVSRITVFDDISADSRVVKGKPLMS